MIYIASPFSHHDKIVERNRYVDAKDYVMHLIRSDETRGAFSPIVYCYNIHLEDSIPGHFDEWKQFNIQMMNAAWDFHVLCLAGWEKSKGVQAEIQWWKTKRVGVSVKYISPIDYGHIDIGQ
jgi:hypothetical protein